MTNQYARGRRFEWEVRDNLRAEGYEVIRAAGSKTKVDLVALKPGQALFIQCKRTSPPGPAERAELIRLAALVDALPIVALKPDRAIEYRHLHGPHHKAWSVFTPDTIQE